MKSIAETWDQAQQRLAGLPRSGNVQIVSAADGSRTVVVDGVLLHSKYDPPREAERLVDAEKRPVTATMIVYGMGVGYHLRELVRRGAERLVVVEACSDVAKAFFETAVIDDPDRCRFFIGHDPADVARDSSFQEAIKVGAEPFRHPASVRLAPDYYARLDDEIGKVRACQRRWKITVVSPLYGGSLPMSRYVANALTAMGHRVDFIDNSIYYDAYKSIEQRVSSAVLRDRTGEILILFLSELMLARALEQRPHIVLALAQAPVQQNALKQLRNRGIVTAFWFVENYRHLEYWKTVAPLYDLLFTIQEGEFLTSLHALGVRNYKYVPTGCDPSIHRRIELSPEEKERYGSDISFAGAGYYNRQQMFEGLVDYNFKIWGTDWGQNLALREFVQNDGAPFTTEEMVKIANASKISLNLHSSAQHEGIEPQGDFVNPRLFEVAACGGFQLVDERKEVYRFFEPESEIVTFRDLRDLRTKIDYYLEHDDERAAIAAQAERRAHRDHTYEHRMAEMLEFMLDRAGDKLLTMPEREYWTVGEARTRPDINPELRSFLGELPAELPFNLHELSAKVLEREGALSKAEAILMMLKEVADNPKVVLTQRRDGDT